LLQITTRRRPADQSGLGQLRPGNGPLGFSSCPQSWHAVQSLLYGVVLQDVMTLSAAPVIVAALALTACTVPAVRAAHVDPLMLLREE
jgi:ABC-type lipoprotein release transport system permease subunit